jgi:acetyl esterase/lipase
MKMTSLITLLFLTASIIQAADQAPVIHLWPNGAPGFESLAGEPESVEGSNICNVHNPSITSYLPDPAAATGTAVIICPGGGHRKLCVGHEGEALAQWFQTRGIAAFVLKYRLAREPDSVYTIQDHAMADTRRAIRLIRSHATEWQLNPQRIGILGFSAGGELAAFAAMESDAGQADSSDPVERASCRPDFQALIYPGTSHLFEAREGMPPVFIACGYGDRPDISEGMASLYLKYKAAGVKAELHIYSEAGHGFGYRPDKTGAAAKWPERFVEWLIDGKLL